MNWIYVPIWVMSFIVTMGMIIKRKEGPIVTWDHLLGLAIFSIGYAIVARIVMWLLSN